MSSKKSSTIFGVVSVVVFILAIVASVFAIKAGNEFKTANETYKLYASTDITFGTNKMSAKTENAYKRTLDCKKELTKYFAISLLMYAAAIIMVLLIFVTNKKAEYSSPKQNE